MSGHSTDIPTRIGPPTEPGVARGRRSTESTGVFVVIRHPNRAMLARRFPIRPGERLSIGRDPSREICLDEATVSRLHGEIESRGGDGVFLRDVLSANGTLRNERPVGVEQTRLVHGDIIGIGPAVRFKFLQADDDELAYHEQISRLVHRDALTGAASAGSFLELTENEFRRARRYERPLSLILFDIDEFKRVNDTLGHLVGDEVLEEIVRRSVDTVRAEETVGRLGGDEFAVLCPETDADRAAELAERLRARVADEPIPCSEYRDHPVYVTCSWGVAALASSMATPSELREAADRALYRSKDEGRNRVSIVRRTSASAR